MHINNYVVYFIQSGKGAVKIGYTNHLHKRFARLQTGNPQVLKILSALPVESRAEARNIEKYLHLCFRDKKVRGEWYRKSIIPLIPEKLATYLSEKH